MEVIELVQAAKETQCVGSSIPELCFALASAAKTDSVDHSALTRGHADTPAQISSLLEIPLR